MELNLKRGGHSNNRYVAERREAKLLSQTDYVKFEMRYEVDATLIGGMIIRIGDRVVDASVKSKLDKMARDMSKIQLGNA